VPAVLTDDAAPAEARKDRRSVDTGVGVWKQSVYVWGYANGGIAGANQGATFKPNPSGSQSIEECMNSGKTLEECMEQDPGPCQGLPKDEYEVCLGTKPPADMPLPPVSENNYPPSKVIGLPQDSIVEMTSGIYNMNAVDTRGCVWGWGDWGGWRDGTGRREGKTSSNPSVPPRPVRIGTNTGGSGTQLCGVSVLSGTEMSGAAITRGGLVYSWGMHNYGGPGRESDAANNQIGAQAVVGLPDPTLEGNRPVQLEGGYNNYWVILENGDVYYFGRDGLLGATYNYERPDQPGWHSGYKYPNEPDMRGSTNKPVKAVQSEALSKWFKRAHNPAGHITQIHSGIGFGGAVLSTGQVITWGYSQHFSALGRNCTTDKNGKKLSTAAQNQCARTPGYVDFGTQGGKPFRPVIIGLSCAFTAMFVLSEDGVLYGWGKPERSYERLPDNGDRGEELKVVQYVQGDQSNDAGAVVAVASGVASYQTGQGYVLWWYRDKNGVDPVACLDPKNHSKKVPGCKQPGGIEVWGRGYNPRGSLGHDGGNWGHKGLFNETNSRPVWFTPYHYHRCGEPYGSGSRTIPEATNFTGVNGIVGSSPYRYADCKDLNIPEVRPGGTGYKYRFTLEECLEGKCACTKIDDKGKCL
jgi:alpha-tubulin suppressor-like RCC1 family protein